MKPLLFFVSLLLLLISCQNNSGKEYAALTDSTSVSGLTGDSVKLVKTGAVNLKVKDVAQSARALSSLVKESGGMVFHHELSSTEEGRRELKLSADSLQVVTAVTPRAELAVRVPSENLETFLYAAADLGYFVPQSTLHIDDRSLDYLQNALKQKARREPTSPRSPDTSRAFAERAIAIKDEAIAQLIANKGIDADAAYSSVHLHLFQNTLVRKETVANPVVAEYHLPVANRLANALFAGWQFFLEFFIAILNLWVFALLGLGGYLLYRHLHKQKRLAAPMNGAS